MRRAGQLFERVVDRDNLRLAVHKALRGKRSKADARGFLAHLDENLDRLRSDLISGEVAVGEFHQFTIRDPKERLITAPCFRERVLHHAIFNVCEPVFDRWLIDDSFACRVGRGRLVALHRARRFAGRSPFFLKLDIRRYFDSISHEILLTKLGRLFKDRRLLDLLRRIIAGFEPNPGRGLPIGSLTSQHFANFYLGWFDRFVKETLRVRGYVRYMDDSAMWGETTGELREHLISAARFLRDELALGLKPEPYLNRTRHGMDFLGCRVYPDHLTLNRRSRVRFRRKLRALESDHVNGLIDEATLQQSATALVAFTRADGLSSWCFRQAVINSSPVGDRWPPTA